MQDAIRFYAIKISLDICGNMEKNCWPCVYSFDPSSNPGSCLDLFPHDFWFFWLKTPVKILIQNLFC